MALAPLADVTDLPVRWQDDPGAARALNEASEAIRDAAGSSISPVTGTDTAIAPTTGTLLALPGLVRDVTEVLVDGVAVTNYRNVGNGLWRRCGWGCEPVPVAVTATFGLPAVPADIVALTVDLAVARLLHDSEDERVRLCVLCPGSVMTTRPGWHHELLVLSGEMTVAGNALPAGSWLRLPPGQDILAMLYPRKGAEAAPQYESLADGVARVTTGEGTDYAFVGRARFQYKGEEVSFDGVAGALTKGPVILLYLLPVALLAPWADIERLLPSWGGAGLVSLDDGSTRRIGAIDALLADRAGLPDALVVVGLADVEEVLRLGQHVAALQTRRRIGGEGELAETALDGQPEGEGDHDDEEQPAVLGHRGEVLHHRAVADAGDVEPRGERDGERGRDRPGHARSPAGRRLPAGRAAGWAGRRWSSRCS
mgnify:CR=1 FL=1